MKTKYITVMIVISIAIAIVMAMAGDASTYVSFSEAKELSNKGFKKSIHVVGSLLRSGNKEITGIEESPDKLSFKFKMVDENGLVQQVFHANPIPSDFTKSEQIVIIGYYNEVNFIADKILLKCPSKYQEEPNFSAGL